MTTIHSIICARRAVENGSALLSSCLLIAAVQSAVCADSAALDGRIFGTTYSIKVRRAEGIDSLKIREAIDRRLNAIDQKMSTYRHDSDVSRFNRAVADTWVTVDPETVRVVELARSVSEETAGAFDITVGPIVKLWNFGAEASASFSLPTDSRIASALADVGYEKLEYQLDPPAMRKPVDGLKVDLSAIAKGYAVDQVCQVLDGMDHYMVEIGGEVRTRGTNDGGLPWQIGLELPEREERRVDSVIGISDQALATSGDYRNYVEHDGETFSHTIDPKTGSPVKHNLAAVTVVADSCAWADAVATALLVMGPERAFEWATSHEVAAMLWARDGGELVSFQTASFPVVQHATQTIPSQQGNSVATLIIGGLVFGAAILAMSLGTLIANRRLQGSCGGMAGLKDAGGKTICDLCTKPSPECLGQPDEGAEPQPMQS